MSKPREAPDRSRPPGVDNPDVRAEVVERATLAPLYVEPGTDGDSLGVEGRHRANTQQLFGSLAHVEKVMNNFADHTDTIGYIIASSSGPRASARWM